MHFDSVTEPDSNKTNKQTRNVYYYGCYYYHCTNDKPWPKKRIWPELTNALYWGQNKDRKFYTRMQLSGQPAVMPSIILRLNQAYKVQVQSSSVQYQKSPKSLSEYQEPMF